MEKILTYKVLNVAYSLCIPLNTLRCTKQFKHVLRLHLLPYDLPFKTFSWVGIFGALTDRLLAVGS